MRSTRLRFFKNSAFVSIIFFLSNVSGFAQTIRYVKPTGTNNNPTSAVSWVTSTTNLQGAINASQPGDQVWVAAGVYKPGGNTNTDRTISFSMKNGVAIYGGFIGNETSLAQRPAINPVNGLPSSSTLSGDIGNPSSTTDNAYHVVSNPAGLTTTAILDGFVITAGNADNAQKYPHSYGGGVYNSGTNSICSPTFRNCSFSKNYSIDSGGAMYNLGVAGSSSPALTNCLFQENSSNQGGAIFNKGDGFDGLNEGNSSPILTNCYFFSNSAASQGGAIYNKGINNRGICKPMFINCSFLNNLSAGSGGAMNNSGIYSGTCNPILINSSFLRNSASSPSTGWAIASSGYQGTSYHVLVNCIFFDNGGNRTFSIYFNATLTTTYSLFEPTAVSGVAGLNLTGPGNLTNVIVSPFASTTSVSLAPNSPAIDAGDPATSSATVGLTDLAGNLRFVGRIDMGAVEFQQLPEIYSLKDGNWTDPLVWSVGRIPQLGERVRLKHTITIPAASTASGIVIIYDPASKLIYETGSKLQLGN